MNSYQLADLHRQHVEYVRREDHTHSRLVHVVSLLVLRTRAWRRQANQRLREVTN